MYYLHTRKSSRGDRRGMEGWSENKKANKTIGSDLLHPPLRCFLFSVWSLIESMLGVWAMSLRQRKVKILFCSTLAHAQLDKEGCQPRCDTLKCEKWESPSQRQFQDGEMPETYFTWEGWRGWFTEVNGHFLFFSWQNSQCISWRKKIRLAFLWTRGTKTVFKHYRRRKKLVIRMCRNGPYFWQWEDCQWRQLRTFRGVGLWTLWCPQNSSY